jgi:hypothetical protein
MVEPLAELRKVGVAEGGKASGPSRSSVSTARPDIPGMIGVLYASGALVVVSAPRDVVSRKHVGRASTA